VPLPTTAAVRLLAAWTQQRRALSDRLEGLLLHGPTAVDRVAARTDEIRAALERERQAFEDFVALAGQPDFGPGPAPDVDLLRPRAYPPLRSVSEEHVAAEHVAAEHVTAEHVTAEQVSTSQVDPAR
jgi:hypothetical protein